MDGTPQGVFGAELRYHRERAVRDSKDPDGPRLIFTPADWQTFTSQVKAATARPGARAR